MTKESWAASSRWVLLYALHDSSAAIPSLTILIQQTRQFPEIDTTDAGLSRDGLVTQAQKTHRSVIQGIAASVDDERVPNAEYCPGIAVAAYNVGCFCGAISTIWIGDRLGRRKTIFLGSSIMVIGNYGQPVRPHRKSPG